MIFMAGRSMMSAAESPVARPDAHCRLEPLHPKTLIAELEDMLGVSTGGTSAR